jgi:hypothetical protein
VALARNSHTAKLATISKTLTTGNRHATRPSDSGSIRLLLYIPAQSDAQTSFAEINSEVPQAFNGGRQWSYNFGQYQLSSYVGAGVCRWL